MAVGSALLSPVAVFAGTDTTIEIEGIDYSCYAVEKRGSDYYDYSFDRACQNAGYERQGDYQVGFISMQQRKKMDRSAIQSHNSMTNMCKSMAANPKIARIMEPEFVSMCADKGIDILENVN